MLKITREQTQLFNEIGRLEFAIQALEHLRAALPDQWVERPDDEALDDVREGIDTALRCGLDEESEVLRFLEVRTLVGPSFGHAPEHAAALNLLVDEKVAETWPDLREFAAELVQSEGDAGTGEARAEG